ncbi:type VII secretion target [Microbacterium ulmi]|uniref:Excreted virulence factor EspC (Type VII ESX diderm) n=1 Tax=Microbacterium ulmi TaxID=179095 RepID=A0A7Y2M1E7_9MICO|nr:type VII secretion target [Microbacterium ulmi]NII68823.1 hypothetical protein [Microbacterium ulmi]NNH04746.1 hypothetical protein [Microbacterium ulmi]
MTHLRVDIDRMRSVGLDLGRIGGEFENASATSDGAAAHAGHDGLADTIRSFARSWDDTRETMVGGIQGLGEAATTIADAFTQTDSDLARALTDPAPAPARPVNRGME